MGEGRPPAGWLPVRVAGQTTSRAAYKGSQAIVKVGRPRQGQLARVARLRSGPAIMARAACKGSQDWPPMIRVTANSS
ncbi:hypothetical protein BHE74_00008470 [Ensete ventricosum]|nr:hypothetical protein BHE74_00008470 [Ensete ventricosum]